MTNPLIERAEQRDYQKLFLHDLNWSRPDQPPVTYEHEGRHVIATNVSTYKGLRIWVVDEKPDSALEAALDQQLAKTSTDRILIFHDDTEQVWRWPVRRTVGNTTSTRLSRHKHRNGDPDPRFAAKLDVIRLPFEDILDSNAVLAKVRQAFDVEAQNETKHASKLMARLYAAMEKAYPATTHPKGRDHEISMTLARILFLMFGDDTDMWPENLFQDFILDHTAADGSDIGAQLTGLFAYLDTRPEDRGNVRPEFDGFRYVNGGIFKERLTLPVINAEFRTAVLDACNRDWTTISPAIFGSMFQSVRDTKARRELGEHYTSEENILKTLNPLFLDELRAEFEHIKTLGKYEADRLRKLRNKLGAIRYMDPACGCGNFIIVAYREMRDLELAIMERLQEITGDGEMLLANVGLKVTLDHFYGIEIDEWPARIAETAVFLIDRQCDLKLTASLGWAPDRLPIHQQATIVVGDALKLAWKDVCPLVGDVIIAGNPPFLGHISRTAKQTDQLREAWDGADIGRLDYVTAWYAKAMKYFNKGEGLWAFVSTNSVTQGDQVPRLFGPVFRAGWRIRFAHRTFAWTSEASGKATVHCNIIGFDQDTKPARLFDYATPWSTPQELSAFKINGYLVDGPNVLVSPRSAPLSPEIAPVTFGNMPRDGGHLVIEVDAYDEIMADKVAAKYVRPFLGSEELVRGAQRWCLWLTKLDPVDLARSPILRGRIEGVRQMRLDSKASSTKAMAATPHLFGQRAAEMFDSYLAIPAVVSESRPFYTAARLARDVIASNKLYVAPDRDGFLFGIISSSMFLTWQFTVGNRLESRPSFSNTLVWNNFPVPDINGRQRNEVAEAGASVVAARALYPTRSLAHLYGASSLPVELTAAHEDLDEVVDSIFGLARQDRTFEGRQRVMFETYVRLDAGLVATPGRNGRTRR